MYNLLASAQKQLSAADIVSWIQLWNSNKKKAHTVILGYTVSVRRVWV